MTNKRRQVSEWQRFAAQAFKPPKPPKPPKPRGRPKRLPSAPQARRRELEAGFALTRALRALEPLELAELERVDAWIHRRLDELAEPPPEPAAPGLDRRVRGRVTYQLEPVKCGKPRCRCAEGELHGPYWYAYAWQDGRIRKRYVGREMERE